MHCKGAVGGTRRQTEESDVYGREIGGLQRCTFFWVHQKLNRVILRELEDQMEASALHQRANKRSWGAFVQFCVHSDTLRSPL